MPSSPNIKQSHSPRWYQYLQTSSTLSFPCDAVPASGQLQNGYFIPNNSKQTTDIIEPPLDDELPWLRWMLHKFEYTVPLQEVADAIWKGDAYIGTNGSAANDQGTYAFAILIHLQQTEPTIAVKCGGNMPDLTEFLDMDSHHPESAALFAALCFVWQLLQQYPQGPFTGKLPALWCCVDNKSIAKDDLDWTFDNVNTPIFNFLKADYDILQGILQAINKLPLKATVHWVKGHQDYHNPHHKLPLSALANCITDDVCTETHDWNPTEVGRIPNWIPGTKAALLLNGLLVFKDQDDYIKTAATTPHLCQHIISKIPRNETNLSPTTGLM